MLMLVEEYGTRGTPGLRMHAIFCSMAFYEEHVTTAFSCSSMLNFKEFSQLF